MQIAKVYFMLSALVFMSACATTPIPLEAAQPVPLERQFLKVTEVHDQQGIFVDFVRDVGVTGSLGNAYLSIDGIDCAALAPGEKFSTQLSLGEHIFTVRAMESKTVPFSRPRSANAYLALGKRYLYRIGWFDGQALQIEPWVLQ
jgi:hypothetical protein